MPCRVRAGCPGCPKLLPAVAVCCHTSWLLLPPAGPQFNQVIVGTTALPRVAAVLREQALPAAEAAARLWRAHWQLPAQAVALRLEAARAAATRCCAYLQCSNVGQAGGPFAGQGEGSKRCSQCRAVW